MADNDSDQNSSVPPARPYAWPKLAFAALALALLGGGLWSSASSGDVTSVRLTKHGLVPEFTTPDYYARLTLKDETEVDTEGVSNVLIGNGLNLALESPVKLSDIVQVELLDDDPLKDDLLDRAEVSGRYCRGQEYAFQFIGSESTQAMVGMISAALGGIGLLVVLIQFVRNQVL